MMRKTIVLALLFSNLVFSGLVFGDEATEQADPEFVRDIYEYCLTVQDPEKIDKKSLLACVNSEMDYYEYTKFTSVEKIIEYIASVIDDE
jgi:hypothetical protein